MSASDSIDALLTDHATTISVAYQKVNDLSAGRERWRLSIPAQPESDPDLVIGRALRIADRQLRALEKAIKALSQFAREHGRNPHQYGQADTCPCDCCWTERALAEVRVTLSGEGK